MADSDAPLSAEVFRQGNELQMESGDKAIETIVSEATAKPETLAPCPGIAGATDPKLDRAKRRQILDGANHVFLTQGFDAASMGAIAQHAGVSKGTLYVYFKNKEELFGAIVEDQRRQHAEQIFTFDRAEDIEVVLIKLGNDFIDFMCRPGTISSLRTVIAISHRMPSMGDRFYMTGPAFGVSRLRDYLEYKVAAGQLAAHDCEVAAAQLVDSCSSLIFKPMMFNVIEKPSGALRERVVRQAVATYLRAWRRPDQVVA
jgi:AcrR family transcriptional regulator